MFHKKKIINTSYVRRNKVKLFIKNLYVIIQHCVLINHVNTSKCVSVHLCWD